MLGSITDNILPFQEVHQSSGEPIPPVQRLARRKGLLLRRRRQLLLWSWGTRSVRCQEHQLQFQNINFNIFLCSKGRCAAEDIADNIGLKLAYNALQHFRGQRDQKEKENCLPDLPFNANQLFWVNNWKDRAKDQIVWFQLTFAMDFCTLEDKPTYKDLLESAVVRN